MDSLVAKLVFVLFAASILISPLWAALNVTSITATITLSPRGEVHVEESVNIVMSNELDVVTYNKAAEQNTFEGWIKTLNNENVKLHVDASKVDVENLQINPQPVRTGLSSRYIGKILISYDIGKNGLPLFTKEQIKPRVYIYELNSSLLSYKRTDAGNIILNNGLVLIIKLPKNSEIVDVNPIPKGMTNVQFPLKTSMVYWRDMILVGFRLKVYIEETIPMEISDYFESLSKKTTSLMTTEEGKITLGIALFLLLAYLYVLTKAHSLKPSSRQWGQSEGQLSREKNRAVGNAKHAHGAHGRHGSRSKGKYEKRSR